MSSESLESMAAEHHSAIAGLSLKARENASRTLKRIFDQINSAPDKPAFQSLLLNAIDGHNGPGGTKSVVPNSADESLYRTSTAEVSDPGFDLQPLRGMRQGTKDFLSLQRPSEMGVDDVTKFERCIRASPQRSAGTALPEKPSAFRPMNQQPKDSITFSSELRTSLPSHNGRCISPEPFKVHASNQSEREAPDEQLKERTFLGLRKPAHLPEANRRTSRPSSPAPSYTAQQNSANGLFPHHGTMQAAPRPSAPQRQPTASLTIFYSGMVHVYDDVPADKANAIMLLAGSGNSWSSHVMNAPSVEMSNGVSTPATRELGALASASAPSSTFSADKKNQLVKRSHTELPYARKVSLARFLEKRKDRVQVKNAMEKGETSGMPEQQQASPKRLCSRPPSPSQA